MKRWTNEEIVFLKENYKASTQEQIAQKLGKTKSSVNSKVVSLELQKQQPVQVGEIFGRLTVISVSHKKDSRHLQFYNCQCFCGEVRCVRGSSLRSGNTISCGCYNKEHCGDSKRKNPGIASWLYLYRTYKINAKIRKLTFLLSLDEFKQIASLPCAYCGELPKKHNAYLKRDGTYKNIYKFNQLERQKHIDQSWILANGIDRTDNSCGYETENCVSCCTDCNLMKKDRSRKDFLSHIMKIANFRKF